MILPFALALLASTLGGTLGMAGGIFVVPLLTAVMHVDIHVAIGASIVSVIASSSAGSPAVLEAGLANVRLAVVLEVATTLGAVTGVLLFGVVPVAALYLLFAVILVVSAVQMASRRAEVAVDGASTVDPGRARVRGSMLDAVYPDPELGRDVAYHVHRLPLGMALMYGAGLISALLGIGSGVLKIPAMDSALRLPIKVSSATSNFMIGVTGAASASAYLLRGRIDGSVAGPVVVGSVVGAMIGSRILLRVSDRRLRGLFVVVLVALAAQMALGAFGIEIARGAG